MRFKVLRDFPNNAFNPIELYEGEIITEKDLEEIDEKCISILEDSPFGDYCTHADCNMNECLGIINDFLCKTLIK